MKSYQYLSGGVNYSDENIYCNDIKDFFLFTSSDQISSDDLEDDITPLLRGLFQVIMLLLLHLPFLMYFR